MNALWVVESAMNAHLGKGSGLRYGAAMRTFDVALPIDLRRSLAPLVSSAQDPSIRVRPDRVVRAAWTPEGPATVDLRRIGERRFSAEADGPGRRWMLDNAPGLVGADDDLDGFDPSLHPIVDRAHRRRPDLRIVRSGQLQDLLVPTILAQRVTGAEAARAWTRILRRWGSPAPGVQGLRLPPPLEALAAQPYWAFHRLGVERSRAQRISAACRMLARAFAHGREGPGDSEELLAKLPGVGPWTAALVARSALGDADAVEVGDFHVKHHVTYALTGRPRGTDDEMLELLAPFPGHRGRVVRLLTSVMRHAPAFAARRPVVPVDQL